jgi:hypothetical protein
MKKNMLKEELDRMGILAEAKKKTKTYTKAEVSAMYKIVKKIEKPMWTAYSQLSELDFEGFEDILMSDARLTPKEFHKMVDLMYEFANHIPGMVGDIKTYVDGGGAITGGKYGAVTVKDNK